MARGAALTPRQSEVLDLRRQDLTVRAIGERLGITHGAVNGHLRTLERKGYLGASEGTIASQLEHAFARTSTLQDQAHDQERAMRSHLDKLAREQMAAEDGLRAWRLRIRNLTALESAIVDALELARTSDV